ncbi:glycoprotein M6B [Phyllostomus discolor]|uniref:Glycoprotein M6B n=1 Tax=Phyllostomus discolor TaxID=89673 RepID=A0A834DUG7_9CHIR|nr:glycoprotein M6B [Phyllostomus discolor]
MMKMKSGEDAMEENRPILDFIHFLMILSSNWAYLKDASKMQAYQDIKAKEEQELQDIQSRSKEQLNSYT